MADNLFPTEVLFDNLCGHVAALMADHCVPGVSVGVLHEGKVYTRGLGVTNVDHPLLVDDGTLFQIGSITKTFTATLAMQLADEGLLDLDATVRTYLPDFRVADVETSDRVTVRHLLTHTANWVGDHFIETGMGDDALARYITSMAELPQMAPMGTVYSYNNAGFNVLGQIIETVTGQGYEALLRDRLLSPLGMNHAYLRAADVMTHRFAVGHTLDRKTETLNVSRPWPLPRATDAVGGLVTTPAELLKYARFHMGDGAVGHGERLLSAEALAIMQEPQRSIWSDAETVGLSWMLNSRDGLRSVSHSGGTVGQISLFAMVPAHNFALVVLTNASAGGSVCRDAYRWVIANYFGCQPYQPKPMASTAETLSAYVGRYERPFATLEIESDDDRLILQVTPKQGFPTAETAPVPPPPPATCALCEPDRLVVLDGPMKDSFVDFIRDLDGEIGWARQGRIHRRVSQ